MRTLLTALLLLLISSVPAAACGAKTDCVIGDRTYRIAMPEGHDGTSPVGAIVHAHGYRGTAAGVMRNKGLRALASRLGVALIAPKSKADDWVIPRAPRKTGNDGSDEFAYFDAMLTDAAARLPVDRSRMMASGFSAGGMMVWNLACHRGALFAGYAPVAGTFWAPVPERCPSEPVSLIHTHGTTDKVVPLGGRPIADTAQGDVPTALALFAEAGGFGPPRTEREGALTCKRSTNGAGALLELCLHDGGHSMKAVWLERAWKAFEASGALPPS